MNVLLLIHGLGIGGAETMVAALARHLRRCGDGVEVACLGALGPIGEELRADGIPVLVHARRPGFDATLPMRLAQRVRAGRFDVVHAHQRTGLFYGLLAALLHRTPLAYTEHSPLGPGPPRIHDRWFNRLLRWRLCRITAVSHDAASHLVSDEGFRGCDVTVVPNGVEVARWRDDRGTARRRGRARCGFAAEEVVIGTVGRFHAVKNQALLIHAIAELRGRRPHATLALIGDGPERDSLRLLAGRLGVDHAVRFLGARRDVAELLPAFDVFCLSSRSEGIPLTLLEAMAARVPVVAAAVGGVPEAARHDVEALLIPSRLAGTARGAAPVADEVSAFTAAIERLLDDDALRRRLTDAAFARASVCFAMEAVCARYRDVLAAVA